MEQGNNIQQQDHPPTATLLATAAPAPNAGVEGDKRGDTPLHTAARADDVAGIDRILTGLTEQGRLEALRKTNDNGATPLHGAAGSGAVNAVRTLLEWARGHEAQLIALRNNNGVTPVHAAARNGRADVINVLFQHVSPAIQQERLRDRTDKDMNPLHLAALNGKYHVAELLVDRYGADPTIYCVPGKGWLVTFFKSNDKWREAAQMTAAGVAESVGHQATATMLRSKEEAFRAAQHPIEPAPPIEPARPELWAERVRLPSRQEGVRHRNKTCVLM